MIVWADVAAFADNPNLSGWSAFIRSYPAMVNEAKKTAFMAGVKILHRHADPFDFKVSREDDKAGPDAW